MIKRSFFEVQVAALFLLGFVTSAYAAGAVVGDEGSLLDFAKPVLEAVRDGHGWIAAAAALVLLSTAARRYLAPKWAFLKTPLGAIALVLTGAYGSAVLVGLAAAGTTTLNASLAFAAFKVALAAAGGYSVLRPLLVDLVEPFLLARFPFLAPVLDLITWAFDKPDAIKVATQAGDDAVVAKPAPGIGGSTTEIE